MEDITQFGNEKALQLYLNYRSKSVLSYLNKANFEDSTLFELYFFANRYTCNPRDNKAVGN